MAGLVAGDGGAASAPAHGSARSRVRAVRGALPPTDGRWDGWCVMGAEWVAEWSYEVFVTLPWVGGAWNGCGSRAHEGRSARAKKARPESGLGAGRYLGTRMRKKITLCEVRAQSPISSRV